MRQVLLCSYLDSQPYYWTLVFTLTPSPFWLPFLVWTLLSSWSFDSVTPKNEKNMSVLRFLLFTTRGRFNRKSRFIIFVVLPYLTCRSHFSVQSSLWLSVPNILSIFFYDALDSILHLNWEKTCQSYVSSFSPPDVVTTKPLYFSYFYFYLILHVVATFLSILLLWLSVPIHIFWWPIQFTLLLRLLLLWHPALLS